MVTPKRTKNRMKLAAVLALGMATMPLNGCDAGAIMGIVQAAAPLIQQVIGQIAADNGGGSGVMGGATLDDNGNSSSPFGTGNASAATADDQQGLATSDVADAAVDGNQTAGFVGQTTAIDGNTSADAVGAVEGATAG